MQISYCESCGVKLSELGKDAVELCETCKAKRSQQPGTSTQVQVEPTSRKSSATRLPAVNAPLHVEADQPSRRTPVGGIAVTRPAPPATPLPTSMGAASIDAPATGSMGFYFCEKCGKRVTSADLARGQGRDKQLKGIYCAGCSDGTMTVAFDAISQADFLKEEQTRRMGNRRSTSTRLPASQVAPRQRSAKERAPRSSTSVMVAVGAGAVILVLCAIVGMRLIGRDESGRSRSSEKSSSAGVPNVTPVSPSSREPAPISAVSSAADQLAKIQAEITPDLRSYAELNDMLDRFLKSYAGTPEAQRAKALRSEIEANYTKLAKEALTDARAAAEASATSGAFDEAASKFRAIETRFGGGTWFESKGKTAVADALADIAKQREAWELKNVAGTLEKARKELQAGRLEEANKLIANRAKWPPEFRTQADELVAAIERKVAEAAAARKLEQEGEAALAEFDRLMIAGQYAEARAYAKSKAAAGGTYGAILGGGMRLAGLRIEEPEAILRGARKLIKQEVQLKTTSGPQEAIVKTVTADGLGVATTYKINNETREKDLELKWSDLHQDQKAEFARLGGIEMSAADKAILATYAALASNDLAAAAEAAGGASQDPLGVHLTEFVKRRAKEQAYESAMKRAEELVAANKPKDAAEACKKALEARPGDAKAVALMAELQRLLPRQPLTLDLGNGVSMEFVYIKPGTFVMGGDSSEESQFGAPNTPKHTVTITKGFYLGKYEVTQAQFQAIMGNNSGKSTRDSTCPMEGVHANELIEFCRKAAEKTKRPVRLPTEAEWEYACRAGTDTKWSHGSDPGQLQEYAWIKGNAGGRPHPVGQKKPNPWGLYDMHGNVAELVADQYERGYYASSPKEDPPGAKEAPAKGYRLLRGGNCEDDPDGCDCGDRRRAGGYGTQRNWMGFRAAVSLTGSDDAKEPKTPQDAQPQK